MQTAMICRGLVVALVLACAGCTTTLDAVRMGSAEALPSAGAPYALPFAQYSIAVTRRLVACRDENNVPTAVIGVVAQITRADLPDPQHHYVIDLQSLHGVSKKTDLVVTYHDNGAIKSINASAEDRTAAVIGHVVKSLGTVIKAGAGVGRANTDGPRIEVCLDAGRDGQPSILELVEERIPAQEGKVRAAERAVAEQLAQLEHELELAQTLGSARKPEDRRQMAEVAARVHVARRELALASESLRAMLKRVTAVDTAVWPVDGRTFGPDIIVDPLTEQQVDAWMSTSEDGMRAIQRESAVYAQLRSSVPQAASGITSAGKADAIGESAGFAQAQANPEPAPGLKYRMPLPGAIEIFTRADRDARIQHVARADGAIPQLGPVYSLPLKSVAFSTRGATATFNAAGVPVSLGVTSSAIAEAAAASLSDTLTQAAAVRDAVVTTELERVQAETALLTARRALIVAQQALEPSPTGAAAEATAGFAADTALLAAELANLNARRALEAARRQKQLDEGG